MQLTTSKGFAPQSITEAIQFSEMLAKSAMVPRQYQGKPEDVMVAVQWGYEIGLAPLQALQNISVINGKPSVYGDAAMALVQASPVCEGIEEFFEGEGTPNPVAVCVARRKGRNPVTAKFSVEDAKRAGLWNKQGPWQAYPKRMLAMRARGFAIRDAFADVLKGLITAEEAQDYPQENVGAPQIQAPKSVQKNPLDAIAPPALPAEPEPVEADPQQEYVEVEEVNQQLQEAAAEQVGEGLDPEQIKAQFEAAGVEVVDVPTMSGFLLKVPGKDEPVSVHQGLEEWSEAYEALADKTAKAGKVPARDRMTKLKALKEANELVLRRLDTIASVKHTASYSKRLAALGAASKDVAQAQ
jgi:hypothetical protein